MTDHDDTKEPTTFYQARARVRQLEAELEQLRASAQHATPPRVTENLVNELGLAKAEAANLREQLNNAIVDKTHTEKDNTILYQQAQEARREAKKWRVLFRALVRGLR